MLVSCGSAIGYTKAKMVSNRVLFIEQYLSMISYIRTQIRYSCEDIVSILERYEQINARSLSFVNKCIALCKKGEIFSESWNKSISSVEKGSGLKKEDIILIKDFGNGLGVSDVEGQMLHCELSEKLMSDRLNNARDEKNKKYRLYQLLGVSSGICIALIFI